MSLALLACLPGSAEPPRLRHRQLSRTRIDERVLALAFVGEGRLLSLATGSVSLWRLDDRSLRRAARASLTVLPAPVRHGGGLIVGMPDESAAWLISSRLEGAQLVRVDGERLVLAEVAEAAPWPGAGAGLRYRSGTNLVDGVATGEGELAIVALAPASRALVREDGMLLLGAAPAGVRVGSAIASLWPDTLVASGPDAPGAEDTLLVLQRERGAWTQCFSLKLAGAVSALAARSEPRGAEVVVALDSASGSELLRLELRPSP